MHIPCHKFNYIYNQWISWNSICLRRSTVKKFDTSVETGQHRIWADSYVLAQVLVQVRSVLVPVKRFMVHAVSTRRRNCCSIFFIDLAASTNLCGFVRNMQASSGTKRLHFRGLTGCFAKGFGLRRKTHYFPIQKRLNITPRRSSAVNSPVIAASDCCARRSSSANSSSAGSTPATISCAAQMCCCASARARR